MKTCIRDLFLIPMTFIIDYDLDKKGLNKLAFYLEEELHFERKRNFENLIIKHEVLVFDICKFESEKEFLADYFTKFENNIKDETKRRIFDFHHLVYLYEKFCSPRKERAFLKFYENFYNQFDGLKYKVDECYNIDGIEFFQIRLKVKVKDKTLKKLW